MSKEECPPDRWDAEDVAEGTPLSGSSELVTRIEDAMGDAWDRGVEQGEVEGYDEAIGEVETALELDTEKPEREKYKEDYDYRQAIIWWLNEALDMRLADAKSEGVNEGIEAMSEALGTKRAEKLAGELIKVNDEIE